MMFRTVPSRFAHLAGVIGLLWSILHCSGCQSTPVRAPAPLPENRAGADQAMPPDMPAKSAAPPAVSAAKPTPRSWPASHAKRSTDRDTIHTAFHTDDAPASSTREFSGRFFSTDPRSPRFLLVSADEVSPTRSRFSFRSLFRGTRIDPVDANAPLTAPKSRSRHVSLIDDLAAADWDDSQVVSLGFDVDEDDDEEPPFCFDEDESCNVDAPCCEPEDDCCFTWQDDLHDLFPVLWDDACSCVTWTNAIILGAGAGLAIGLREDADGEVRAHTASHPDTWGEGSQVLRQFGEFSYQLPVLFACYGWSLWSQDEHLHEFSKAVISAYGITALTTVTIKGIADTRRPSNEFQDGRYGFPSYHAASTFAIAAVADEYYGWPVGVPCYVLAGLVGWSRIDQREHDLSDVVFGSILGFVIGKSVAATHMDGLTGLKVVPYFDPATNALGATFHRRF